jgi:hypothetical protein
MMRERDCRESITGSFNITRARGVIKMETPLVGELLRVSAGLFSGDEKLVQFNRQVNFRKPQTNIDTGFVNQATRRKRAAFHLCTQVGVGHKHKSSLEDFEGWMYKRAVFGAWWNRVWLLIMYEITGGSVPPVIPIHQPNRSHAPCRIQRNYSRKETRKRKNNAGYLSESDYVKKNSKKIHRPCVCNNMAC